MTRALSRTNFNSSRLVRSLAGLSRVDIAESNQSLAERLGQWLDVAQAIALFAALRPPPAHPATAGPGALAQGGTAIANELEQLRALLIQGITAEGGGTLRLPRPQPPPDAPLEIQADFLPYRRYYFAQQREMAAQIGRLRGQARQALSGISPRLRQLADLDAALDQAFGDRERDLLATVPGLLEKRFQELRQEHLRARGDSSAADDPARWHQPGGWLARFGKDLQDVLLAELELRLLPVTGLIEEYGNEVTKHQ